MDQTPTSAGGAAAVLDDLLRLLADMMQDWDLDFASGLGAETRLVADLGFESIDVVMLIGEINRLYDRTDLPFEDLLITDGRYVDDVALGTLADFVARHLGVGSPGTPSRSGAR